MKTGRIVSRDEWLDARKELLAAEKAFTRDRDALTAKRRNMPWVKIDKDYRFQGPDGEETLADLFGGKSQLVVYHFMYGPDWTEGCPSCSFWADNFNGVDIHLKAIDITLLAVSNTSLEKINAYKKRMDWTFKWVSSLGSDFNRDFHVSFTPEEVDKGEMEYNYRMTNFPSSEAPGASVFAKGDDGAVYHAYSTYERGLDMLNGAYHYIDLTPKGRTSEEDHGNMHWLKRRDQYQD